MAMVPPSKCHWDVCNDYDQFFLGIVRSWFVGCPWILVTVSFQTSSRMSARTPIVVK